MKLGKIFTKKRLGYLGFSLLNALIMFRITFYVLGHPYVWFDEFNLIQYSSITKNLVLGWEEKPDSNRFLFINVAWDKALTEKTEQVEFEGEDEPIEFPIGNEPITDRAKLADLFKLLSKYHKEFKVAAVCDVNFMGFTEEDERMIKYLNKVPNLIVSYHRDDNDKPVYPDLKVKKKLLGLSDIEKVNDGMCVKFKMYYNDSIKSTPLRMYEIVTGKKFKKRNWWFHTAGGLPRLNYFILDYRVRSLDYENSRYAKVHLGESFLSMVMDPDSGEIDEEFLKELIKDRIIIVGDFEDRDIHDTIYGELAGPLILLNAFLAIEAGDNIISWVFLLYLLFAFIFISYACFATKSIIGTKIAKWLPGDVEGILAPFTVYMLYFITISVISFFLFGIHIAVFLLAVYLFVLEKIKLFLQKRREKRAKKQVAVDNDAQK